jgi:predicted cupin superfamily sugar epimerase
MIDDVARELIDRLELLPHPEGGYYRETYRSKGVIAQSALTDFDGERNFSTAIYFMLTSRSFSALHRIRQDEVWHFYTGSPLHVHVIDANGKYRKNLVGINISNGEVPQLVVKAGDWFGATVAVKNSFALVGCTVAPGFDFRDFEMGTREQLNALFPQHAEVIGRLTRI